MKKLAITVGTALIPGVASAHPMHASGGNFGLVHFVTDPFHVAMTAGAVLSFLAIRRSFVRARSKSRPPR